MPAISDRIPPQHADLEFIRSLRTGTVHVQVHVPEPWADDSRPEPRSPSRMTDEEIVDTALAWASTLCGLRFAMVLGGSGEWVTSFPDEVICGRCVHALGDQSPRAFEHPQGDGEGQVEELRVLVGDGDL